MIALPPSLLEQGVVAVIRARDTRHLERAIDALVEGGLANVELTLTIPGILDALPRLVERYSDRAVLGLGTVTSPAQASAAIDAGAAFLVTPAPVPGAIETALAAGIPILPGGLTPGELFASWSAGAPAVKLFPASTVGPSFVGHLHGPLPELPVVPSGGIAVTDAADWIRAGAIAVSLGGPLLGDGADGGDPAPVTARAREVLARVAEARSA